MTAATADPASTLHDRLARAVRAALPETPADFDPMLTPSRNPEFGDFQSNCAMILAKSMGMPPREAAQRIVEQMDVAGIAETPTVAGPGFINISLIPDALAAGVGAMDTPELGITPAAGPAHETVVVDLCGVNLAKQMHVGHLRATVIGDALARLYERLGHTVHRQNHFGDWGLPIAMVTARIKDLADAGALDLDTLTEEELERHYREAQLECSADRKGLEAVRRYGLGPKAEAELEEQVAGADEAMARAREALVRLQSGNDAYVHVWKTIARITLRQCFENCRRLHANVTEEHTAGESTYRDELADVVREVEQSGASEVSDGALVVRLEDEGIREPLIVRKRDGGYLYATTDLAGIRRRVRDLGADRLIYAVDARQSLHFKQVFAAARKVGFTKTRRGGEAQLIHAAFGTVLGEDGRPFKTRSGENVKLRDLLGEAVQRAERAVAEKNPDLTADERARVAEAVGIGAIKYADLSSDRVKDYVFSFDRMLTFEGATGPYLQYAHVRIMSIFRKAREEHGIDVEALAGPDGPALRLGTPEERAIALELLKYPGVIHAAAETCEPHRLCNYLFDLATAFSTFFTACPVLRAPDEATRDSRLRLCGLTGRVLRDGLKTLGIVALERM